MEYNGFNTFQLSAKHAHLHAFVLFEQFPLSLRMPKLLGKLKGLEGPSKLNSEIMHI